ncbi:SRPBCC family protein [Candidatus Wolfebacteria bacterium]|nr:SRPBCC family protein [Candidatus Wolfebacteria bacterium]
MKADKTNNFERHYENSAFILAGVAEVFTFLDDHARLSSHMNKPSWMMGGGRVDTSVDAGHGQEVGSHIRMSGKAFGISIFLDEVVTYREPPRVKVFETVGMPKLLVIGQYRMRFEVEPRTGGSLLSVSIDYNLPMTKVWLGKLFSGIYAKWCVQQAIKDVRDYLK